jgi:DNA-directed RNA polymerase specialized sigma24 family protein
MRACLGLSPQEREAVTRFFIHGQNEQRICSEMQLPPEQFRALKSKAKAKFSELLEHNIRSGPDGHSQRRAGFNRPFA